MCIGYTEFVDYWEVQWNMVPDERFVFFYQTQLRESMCSHDPAESGLAT